MTTKYSYHQVLLPGQVFPQIIVPLVNGEKTVIKSNGTNAKLVVIYRGQFCPFCRATLHQINESLQKLHDAGIDVIAVSADLRDAATDLVQEMGLQFPVGHSLQPEQFRVLGTFVSSPTNYVDQGHLFSEPAWFLIDANDRIRYSDYGSAPFAGRPNVDAVIAGYLWAVQEGKERPSFRTVVFGSIAQ
ncbi:thioredoxin-like protein [Rhizoclosmatium globosum]|uniref:Thioredoxin-like protein n=1 Tax=Rhizoclosmatium globosum TaxID=329046 RepID=A0A1Y2BWK0_9FUNG|nr:hypothetical protein HDU79_005437 [Rhizoclosmatium sp. JEL0117]ORY39027.1 thioredoxin-like protein [Rhizoclosmatium globosum]|eukprot:ORY39027.1 thioredoxin-like protein [Rhizoclosmatium globosum]